MQAQSPVVIQLRIRPLLETVAQQHHPAAARNLQIQFNMPVTEDVIIAVITLILLLFGEQYQLFLVLALVRTRVRNLLQPALLGPVVTEIITPTRRQTAETELQERAVEHFLQKNEPLDLPPYTLRVIRLPITR